jgi:hypothetical protein
MFATGKISPSFEPDSDHFKENDRYSKLYLVVTWSTAAAMGSKVGFVKTVVIRQAQHKRNTLQPACKKTGVTF